MQDENQNAFLSTRDEASERAIKPAVDAAADGGKNCVDRRTSVGAEPTYISTRCIFGCRQQQQQQQLLDATSNSLIDCIASDTVAYSERAGDKLEPVT